MGIHLFLPHDHDTIMSSSIYKALYKTERTIMNKKVLFYTLFGLLLTSSCLAASRSRRGINWNGNNWAMSCDFRGNDLGSAQVAAPLCGPTCERTSGCTHFTWTQYNGGTCWMKRGSVTKNDAFSTGDSTMVCGVLNDNGGGETPR